jgi:fido (protein-threonine AMPylation protein)
MKSYPNLYTDTSTGDTDPFEQVLANYSLDSGDLRTFILTYQDRILFGTYNATGSSGKTADCEASRIRAHRDLLEKDTYNYSAAPGKVLKGLHLEASVLLKIYRTNAEGFLEMPELKDRLAPRENAGQRRRDSREGLSWLRLNDFMTEALTASRPVNENFLLALNRLVLQDFPEHRRTRGQYRKTSVVIRRMGNVMHVPPKATDVPLLMRQLLSSIDPPSGRAAVAHVAGVFLRLQEIHPFFEGNGRTARALATYLLRRSGFREKRGHSLERYFDANIEDCYDTLYQSGKGDPLPWLLFFAAAVESEMSDEARKQTALSRIVGRLGQSFHPFLTAS